MSGFDYSNYGAFKQSHIGTQAFFARAARKLGLRNRYVRFLKLAKKELPVVELGCGTGAFIKALLDEGFRDVKGVEPSATYHEVVDDCYITRDYAAPFLSSIPTSTLGAVVALDVFEHIPLSELQALLALIASRLVAGGFLVFRMPNMSSPLALPNQYGDLSHTTSLNEHSVRQLAFATNFRVASIHSEPFSYPRSISAVLGILIWPAFWLFYRTIMSAFGISDKILTPNMICVLVKLA
jgi:SAM-dependent methyltransferase